MHALLHCVPTTLQQATTDPRLCQRLLDTHGQVWASLSLGHCSFVLGPGAHKVLFVPSKRPFPQSCVRSGGSMVGLPPPSRLMPYLGLLLPRASAFAAGHFWPIPLQETLEHSSSLASVGVPGSWCAQALFEPSEHLWWVWAFFLNVISPLIPSCWGFSFAPGHGVSFLVRPNILLSTVVQQQVVIFEFLQENMSTHPSTAPSCSPSFTLQIVL